MPLRLPVEAYALLRLPIESDARNTTRQVANACFSRVQPTPVSNPVLVAVSRSALATIGLTGDEPGFLEAMAGCEVPEGCDPVAHCYCGHQFGSFAGQLGDGAAILLGEVKVACAAADAERIELQLKGAGPTPYSRSADGRKVLRSSIREFLCSEAMFGLGIPTTRAASIVTSDTRVERDPLYSGASVRERCSIVSRLSRSFIRFGSFEVVLTEGHDSDRHGPSPGNTTLSRQLFDFVATTYFGAPTAATVEPSGWSAEQRRAEVVRVLEEITRRTAELVAAWQAVGWVHGVLNTDNMSILGLTIDYGPFAFQEHFDPLLVSNTSDTSGKYAYAHQPAICEWNLLRLAEAFAYVEDSHDEQEALATDLKARVKSNFLPHFQRHLDLRFQSKLGLPRGDDGETAAAARWREAFLSVLADTRADFTLAFHVLEAFVEGTLATPADAAAAAAGLCMNHEQTLNSLKRRAWRSRPNVGVEQAQKLLGDAETAPERIEMMFGVPVEQFKEHMRSQIKQSETWAKMREAIAQMSTVDDGALSAQRQQQWTAFFSEYEQAVLRDVSPADRVLRARGMKQVNPRFILRPWVAQTAIAAAEKGDYTVTQRLVDRLLKPFDEDPLDAELFSAPPPDYTELCVSCSS